MQNEFEFRLQHLFKIAALNSFMLSFLDNNEVLYLTNQWNQIPVYEVCNVAAMLGHLDLLKWARLQKFYGDDETLNHLESLRIFYYTKGYFLSKQMRIQLETDGFLIGMPCLPQAFLYALTNNHAEIIHYLQKNDCQYFDIDGSAQEILEHATQYGNLQMIRWLIVEKTAWCNYKKCIDIALRYEKWDCIVFLKEEYNKQSLRI